MNIYTNPNSAFPSQVVDDATKASEEYGLQVSRAIEQEWFNQGRTSGNRYLTHWNNSSKNLYKRNLLSGFSKKIVLLLLFLSSINYFVVAQDLAQLVEKE